MAKQTASEYFTPHKKRTSIGHSKRTRPKSKNKRKQWKRYNII